MKVIIAGAGLGGLCLAHGLLRAGLDVQVLERRATPADQPASYGIHFNSDGLSALRSCLPAANWSQLLHASVEAPDVVRFQDERLRSLAVISHENPAADPALHRRAVSRGAARDALLLGLNTSTVSTSDVVQWDRAVTGYDHDSAGQLVVSCADGSQLEADLLVAADGANSVIRAHRLPGLDRVDLGILNVAGRLPLTPELSRHLPVTLTDGSVNNVVPAGPGWMFASTWQIDVAGPGRAPSAGAEFFLVWAWAADRHSYPADPDTLSPGQLRDHVAACVSDWAPALRRIVAATDPATIAPVSLRTMPQLPAWTPSDVTLLGDAIHNMTPMAGIGANTALRDADQLRQALVARSPASLAARVASYEDQMRGYANQALALSARNARNAASPRRLPRLAFRSALRVAEAIPPAKRRMFRTTPVPASR